MKRRTTSGKVAHCLPGSMILTPEAVQLLARHLAGCFPATDPKARAVVADIIRMSCARPPSRDTLTAFLGREPESEISTTEAGRRLGISPSGVRKRIERGTLPARHDGRRWLISLDDVERLT